MHRVYGVAETLQIFISEVFDSNLYSDTGYTDRDFVIFLSLLRQILGQYIK
jgi:hypothetical protein